MLGYQTHPTSVLSDRAEVSTLRGVAYRPHLDGLRAVAVYLVVLFHSGIDVFGGGFIGVDVFFVLSGYLVTQLLLRDLDGIGGIRFGHFYARRFRRLLPAAFLTLIITAAVYTAVASPADALEAKDGFQASFLYYTNWFLLTRATAYFGGDVANNPVLHFWSLAVEEQFYLLWPLLFGGLFLATRRLGERQRTTIRVAVGAAAVASLGWALFLQNANPNHAYYGTDARAYQLLAGASLALAPGWIASVARSQFVARSLATIGFTALGTLASSWVDVGAITRGMWVTLSTCALLVGLESAERGAIRRMLSSPSVVYLGKVSYGTYLWHWMVIIVVTKLSAPGPLATAGIAGLAATSFASLSFQLVERPVRESRWLDARRGAVIVAGLSLSALSALVAVPAIVVFGSASTSAQSNAIVGFTPIPPGLDFAHASYRSIPVPPVCLDRAPEECILAHGTGRHVLLMGDSHAQMLLPTFLEIAHREQLTLSAVIWAGCPWQRFLYTPMGTDTCIARKEDAYTRVIPALHPDVIVLVNFGYDDLAPKPFPILTSDGRRLRRGQADFAALVTQLTKVSIAQLNVEGRRLVIVEPIPRTDVNATECLKTSKVLEACRVVADTRPSPLELEYRAFAKKNPPVLSADFDRLVCPYFPICDPVIAGHIVKVDSQHLTTEFAQYIAGDVDAYLKANGVLPQ